MSQALVFNVEEGLFAFPLDLVREVVRSAWPVPLPRPTFGCVGALNVRGELHPLVDLGALLGLRRQARSDGLVTRLAKSQVVLARVEGDHVGFLVDRTLGIGEAAIGKATAERAAKLGARLTSLMLGQAMVDGAEAILIDPTSVVGPRRNQMLHRAIKAQEAS